MRLASKAALLLSPDLRAVAKDAREARDLLRDGHAQLVGQGARIPAELPNAYERIAAVVAALEGRGRPRRSSQPGLTFPGGSPILEP